MTTIAYKDGIIACDSCFGYGETVDTLSTKIYRLKSGALLGQAGDNDARQFVALLNNVKSFKAMPSRETLMAIRSDFFGLMVFPNGRIAKVATMFASPENWTGEIADDVGAWEIEMPFTAIGTGSDFAIGAMGTGASARNAVRVACRYDMNSRLPVHWLELVKGK